MSDLEKRISRLSEENAILMSELLETRDLLVNVEAAYLDEKYPMMSHAKAILHPAPRAAPFTAAITGLFMFRRFNTIL